MAESIPNSLGRYVILEEIGRGMMGAVYRASDPQLGRTVALKTVRLSFAVSERELEQFEKRFLTEALAAGQLSHPGIVVVHDVGRDSETGTLYIALEHLEGRTLDQLAEEPLEWREALRLVARIAEALCHAHSRGIVHRDIKPSNIMVLPNGEPKIMDFGIAKLPTSTLTLAGQFFGTPAYMSPEQATGVPVDGRSDLFSLGAILYLLLTGKRAFPGNSIPAIVTGVQSRDPGRPSAAVPQLPEAVDYVVARALAKDLAYRYPDARLFAEDLEDIRADRAPRHRAGWIEPPAAEGTVVATPSQGTPVAVPVVVLPEVLPLEAAPPEAAAEAPTLPEPASPGPVAPSVLAVPSAAAEPALLPVVAQARSRPRPKARRVPARAVAVFGAACVLAASGVLLGLWAARRLTGHDAQAEAPRVAAPSRPATSRAAQRSPEGAAEVGSTSAWSLLPGFAAPARLELALEHSLRSGALRVWVDEELLLEQALVGQVSKKVLIYKARRGALEKTLNVRPGEHTIRVRIETGEDVMEAKTTAVFESGVTRRLEIEAGGLLKKRLSLDWAAPTR